MSLVHYHINRNFGKTAIWRIDEEPGFFENKLGDPRLTKDFKTERQRIEWLSSRFLFHLMDDISPNEIHKDKYGKPHHLSPDSPPYLSISHSNGYVVAGVSSNDIGIDIQTYVEKIYRIRHKFTTDEEVAKFINAQSEMKVLHFIWTIKEAVFKLYGRKELPFIKGIQIKEVEKDGDRYMAKGKIEKGDELYNFQSFTYVREGYCYSVGFYDV